MRVALIVSPEEKYEILSYDFMAKYILHSFDGNIWVCPSYLWDQRTEGSETLRNLVNSVSIIGGSEPILLEEA